MRRKVRIAIGLPWYKGPDDTTFMPILGLQHYFGRIEVQSRLSPEEGRHVSTGEDGAADLHHLDETLQEQVELDFCICVASNISLPGMAREIVVEQAINAGADVLFSFDYDMIVTPAAFMRLLLDVLDPTLDVRVVAALAFTGRLPLAPVIYEVKTAKDGRPHFDPKHDYVRNALQKVGAFGTGTFMANMEVFKAVPKPWFNVAGGMGEDLFFTGVRCFDHGVPVYVDTRAKVLHKPTVPVEFHGEEMYLRQQALLVKGNGNEA